jgi:hypothetical protein
MLSCGSRGASRGLIYINKQTRAGVTIFPMPNASTKEFSLIRMIALAAMLFLAPFSAFAGGLEHHVAKPAGHSASHHQADVAMDSALEHYIAPAETPLHCHQKSPAPQATALILGATSDQQPPFIASAPLRFAHAGSPPIRTAYRPPVAGPPRFILFGNFRS